MASILRPLAEDDSVAAVVLRVDSPGGSSLASDLILREVTRLAEVKPVVASLSDVAASGGYYIASKATAIVAEEATVTGSIGVYGGKLVTRGLEEDLLGMTRDSLMRGANADIYSPHAPFSPEQARRIEALMRRVYDTFIAHVAEGRGLSREEVAAVAEGRVWAGVDAVRLGLVDEIGGLDRALELAADAADIDAGTPLQLEFHPRGRDLLDWLFQRGEPLLPARLAQLRRHLGTDGWRVLELPPEMTSLAHPF
jgi:protease-4